MCKTTELDERNPRPRSTFQDLYYQSSPGLYHYHTAHDFPLPAAANAMGYQGGGYSMQLPSQGYFLPPIQNYENYRQMFSHQNRGGSGILDFYIQKKLEEISNEEKNRGAGELLTILFGF